MRFDAVPSMPRRHAIGMRERCRLPYRRAVVVDDPEVLDSLFHEAVTAIDAGDVVTLERLLAAHPRLVRDRLGSPGTWLRDQVGGALDGFFQQPYLLWFVAEDPVRQGRLPRNIAEVTRAILQAAEREGVDSLPEQLRYTLHLAVCSPVGREDGLQRELIDALFEGYLAHPTKGLWIDRFDGAGRAIDDATPASILYHLHGAAEEAERYLAREPAS